MSAFNNLVKQFVNSLVRQVGRDGGKVLSNKMFKGKHGTPIYRSGNPNEKELEDGRKKTYNSDSRRRFDK